MEISGYFPYVIIGRLWRDYVIFADGSALEDQPGGELLFTAAGLSLWERNPALVARIGADYPEEWIERIRRLGFDCEGIKRLHIPMEHRRFQSFFADRSESSEMWGDSIPNAYFRAGLPLPRSLLGLNTSSLKEDSKTQRTEGTIIFRDIPSAYLESRCIHFCPMDYLSHNLLPQFFRRMGEKTVTMQTSPTYMIPFFWYEMEHLVKGLSAVITTEEEIRSLFAERLRVKQIADMARQIQDWGVDNVVVQLRDRSVLLLEVRNGVCYTIPPYSEDIANPRGELPAFCGGFMAGLNDTYDPVTALIRGAAAAGFAAENRTPFTIPGVISNLLEVRMEILGSKVKMAYNG